VTLAQAQSQGSGVGAFVVLLPLIVVFYFVAIRPGRRRMHAMAAVQRQLEPGREVVTTAGMYARITGVDEDAGTVTLEIAPGVQARFARAAVMKVVDEERAGALLADGDD
jgi:preprotein translocase subunit YajC